jgi:hydrogenase/urease accessory protein HupE
VAADEYEVRWRAPLDLRNDPVAVEPSFPAGCTLQGTRLRCAARALREPIRFPGLAERRQKVVVSLARLDGTSALHVLREGEDAVQLASSPVGVARRYVALGVEHILGGVDHLLFVLGLLLLIERPRRLIETITAFTVAHSITLAASVLGVVELSAPAVEAVIALSIVLVAREALMPTATLTTRAPWLVAAAFGLLHGFGFAGALREVGLPDDRVAGALLWFNVGVELGQLLFVAAALLLAAAAARVGLPTARGAWTRRVLAYGAGIPAAVWTIERVAAAWGLG